MGSNIAANLANPGGVPASGPQTAFAQYSGGQQALRGADEFSHCMGHSTGATQAEVSGPQALTADIEGKESVANTQAIQNFVNQQAQSLTGGLGSIFGSLGGKGG